VGLLVVLVGIALDNRMVVWVAIALLAGSVAIRFALAAAARRRGSGSEAPPEGE
jgi:phosphatidylglycerophosphate synthase